MAPRSVVDRSAIVTYWYSGALGGGLEYQNSEAFQGEVWRGRGIGDVEKPNEFIDFSHPPGFGLWALGDVHFGVTHLCPWRFLYPSKTYGFL